jgi:hypothetical protein
MGGGRRTCTLCVAEGAYLFSLLCSERVKQRALHPMEGTCACPDGKGFLFTGLDLLGCIFFLA